MIIFVDAPWSIGVQAVEVVPFHGVVPIGWQACEYSGTVCDSVIVYEGETPMLRLVDAMLGGGDLKSVPNLVYLDGADGEEQQHTSPYGNGNRVRSRIP